MAENDDLLPAAVRADVQGFVTTGFGHLPHSAYLPLVVTDRARAKSWLRLTVPRIRDASSWRIAPDMPKVRPRSATNLAVSFAGLRALGLSERALASFPDEFREGMAEPQRARVMGDTEESAPGRWQLGGPRGPEIHLLLILNHESEDALSSALEGERADFAAAGGVEELAPQLGRRYESEREPFGFQDGMGQPRIRGIQRTGVATGEFILGYPGTYAFIPPSPLVPAAEDPGEILPRSRNPYHRAEGWKDFGRHGSYLVYRKLCQDVAGFWGFLRRQTIHDLGKPDPYHMVWLASKMVGRWPSGAPLVRAPERDEPKMRRRDAFLYAELDPHGARCPFGSHVRRANPRDVVRPSKPSQSLRMSDAHRILRRASVWGEPLFDLEILADLEDRDALAPLAALADDGRERGVHFFSVNASIRSQFEFVQQAWCNNPRFNGLTENKDPLIGDHGRPGDAESFMTIPGTGVRQRTAAMPRFVTVKGGGYFFLPSLTALRYLAAP